MILPKSILDSISSRWSTRQSEAPHPHNGACLGKLEALAAFLEQEKDYHKGLEPLTLYRQLCPHGPIAARSILLTRDNEDGTHEAVNHLEQWRLAKIEELREKYEKGQKEHFEEIYRKRKLRSLKPKIQKAQLLRRRSVS